MDLPTNFFQSLGTALVNSLWQYALLWLIYHVILFANSRIKSIFKTILSAGLLFAGFGWFLLTFFVSFFSGETPVLKKINELSVFTNTQGNLFDINNIYPIVGFTYLLLLVIPVHKFIKNYRYVQALKTYGLRRINIDTRLFIKRTALNLGISRPVKAWISEFITTPATVGFLKPVILIPLAAINHLSPQQLETILLHELAHIKRNDYLLNLLVSFVKSLFYFNPFVKAFSRIIEKERELSCDELVLQFQYNSSDYATALLMLEKEQQKALAVSATGHASDLIHRVENILGIQKKRTFSTVKLYRIAATFLFIIAAQVVLQNNKPHHGQRLFDFEGYIFSGKIKYPVENSEENKSLVPNQFVTDKKQYGTPKKQDVLPFSTNQYGSNYLSVSFEDKIVPSLKYYQEEQVKKTIEVTRKIIETSEWQKVETDIAEVLSESEKVKLKDAYQKGLDRFNWENWEYRLKQLYNNIDWDIVNNQLHEAITQMKADSLQKAYNEIAIKLDEVQKELLNKGLKGIPDSDISLNLISENLLQVQKRLAELKQEKGKKVVRL